MLLVAAYVLFLVWVVVRLFRTPTGGEVDFLVAGRRLTLPGFVASLVSTWYGGILGVGEYGWSHGISSWLVFGVPYYLYALVFALVLARRARRSRVLSPCDVLEQAWGRPAALVGAGTLFVMTAPAAYVLMLGVLVQLATGWPLWVGVLLGTVLSVGYVFRGGLSAVVATDKVQFVLMFAAFLVLVPVCAVKYGGLGWLRAHVPTTHFAADGGLGWQAVLVWYAIAAATLTEPAFYQRCYAAVDERTARTGILVSLGFWVLFDVLTTTAGLYARAVLPDLPHPVAAFPELAAAALPQVWQGLFMVGLLATIMSTVDSYAFLAAVTLGRDLVRRRQQPEGTLLGAEDVANLRSVRWALAATAALAMGLALWSGSVVELWKTLGSIGTPVLLLPLLLGHLGYGAASGADRRRVWLGMALAGAVSGAWMLLGRGVPFLGIEAIFPGLVVSAALVWPVARTCPRP
ncbi:MAG: sodium:solute symporter family protein [Candidatus Krumholzibacteriia bacterium]